MRLHLSRRSLQVCFDDVLGLSPLQAIRALRLNGARRSLRAAAACGQGVQDVQDQELVSVSGRKQRSGCGRSLMSRN